ncbi:hypothetical protein BDP27DRAFT_1427149 [Rhodocollybia butyracea]|uniref:Uncharacterized protein n=1 Tax=Rhodocollybia butyracea TaxID=206335 RepID=A0A9P5PJK1_9AGAR|nr:hypothetical protein BDP27DRAFT_1427149 [Rhodocollybia butyracea]
MSHLEVDSIQVIAMLPKLTDLSLTIPDGIPLDYTGVEGGFPSLTDLWLQGSTSDACKFLGVSRLPALQELNIDLYSGQSPLSDIAAINCLLRSCPFLRRLVLSFPFMPGIDDLQLWSIFEPLLELTRLEYLRYNIPLPISHQKACRIPSAWPHLKYFSLPESSTGDSSPVETLAHFARHCPNLENLCYPIQLQITTPTTVIQIHPTLSRHPLCRLTSFVETEIMAAHAMAQALHQIFPNLAEVVGPGDGWAEVQKILHSFQGPIPNSRGVGES